jgi:endonuclease-3
LDHEGLETRAGAARIHQGKVVTARRPAPPHVGRLILRLRRQAPRWRQTALAEVAERRRDPFQVLIACLLSLRTKDETTGPAAARLFALADTPAGILRLTPRQIQRAIFPVGFYRTKSRVLRGVCRDLLERFGGRVPDTIDDLLTLKGVGRKTANLVVTQAYHKPGICVDIHVHRISNRWGYVRTATPEKTEMALRARLPRRYWIGYNDLLVSFGQNVCQPVSPKCSLCPVADLCPRIGVTRFR